jgi:glutamate-1-semialdehyde aminotransferase
MEYNAFSWGASMSTDQASRVIQLQRTAEQYLPGGVAGSGRFNPSLGYALFVASAEGAWLP